MFAIMHFDIKFFIIYIGDFLQYYIKENPQKRFSNRGNVRGIGEILLKDFITSILAKPTPVLYVNLYFISLVFCLFSYIVGSTF